MNDTHVPRQEFPPKPGAVPFSPCFSQDVRAVSWIERPPSGEPRRRVELCTPLRASLRIEKRVVRGLLHTRQRSRDFSPRENPWRRSGYAGSRTYRRYGVPSGSQRSSARRFRRWRCSAAPAAMRRRTPHSRRTTPPAPALRSRPRPQPVATTATRAVACNIRLRPASMRVAAPAATFRTRPRRPPHQAQRLLRQQPFPDRAGVRPAAPPGEPSAGASRKPRTDRTCSWVVAVTSAGVLRAWPRRRPSRPRTSAQTSRIFSRRSPTTADACSPASRHVTCARSTTLAHVDEFLA